MSDENKLEVSPVTESTELVPATLTKEQREALKQESAQLLVKLTQETNIDKTRDLTYLFNVNHSKKAMLRQQKLDEIMDNVVDELGDRVEQHPEEFDTDTLIRTATTLQNIMEKNAMQVNTPVEQPPLIQVQKTDININTTEESAVKGLNSTQRKNVNSFLSGLLNLKLPTEEVTNVLEDEIVSVSDDK